MDQVRVVWLWGSLGQYGAGLRHEAGLTRGWADTGRADTRTTPATQSRKFENQIKSRILVISISKVRPALNAADFSTYTVKISDLKVVSFMVYTYNIQGRCDGTRRREMIWSISMTHPTPPHPPCIMPMTSHDVT